MIDLNTRLLEGKKGLFLHNLKEEKKKGKKSLQHLLFPGGHPSKYWAGPTLLNFGDQTRTGVFSVVWP